MFKKFLHHLLFVIFTALTAWGASFILWEAVAQAGLASGKYKSNDYTDRAFAVFSGSGWGTGWVVKLPDFEHLYIMTAAHVCGQDATLYSKQWGKHNVLVMDVVHDTCVLEFTGEAEFLAKGLVPLRFSKQLPEYFDNVHAISFTDPDQEYTIFGIVLFFSQVKIPEYGFNYNGIRHSAPTIPGTSGGPILNDKNEVVCMTTMVWFSALKRTPFMGECVTAGDVEFSIAKHLKEDWRMERSHQRSEE